MIRKGLGRGLQALIPRSGGENTDEKTIIEIPVKNICVNKKQPRHSFDEDKLVELAQSIKEHGVVQPIIVRKTDEDMYEIVAGERRWRASKNAGFDKIPAIVKELTEKEMSEISLIENIQREDLNPIEEATAYKALMEEYGLTQEDLSARVGKSRPFIANTVRLLALPEKARAMVLRGTISAGHARTLLAIPKTKELLEMANKIAEKGLSVRQTEKEVKHILAGRSKEKKATKRTDPIISDLEEKLKRRFSTKVVIRQGKKSGRIEIEYYGEEELQRLLDAMLGEEAM
jgi:ParB family chromosome partitioning protein